MMKKIQKQKNPAIDVDKFGDRRRWDDISAMIMEGLRFYRRSTVEGGCDGGGGWKGVCRRWKVQFF
jgi:hypothetical protein